jgi:hypothetical protein
MALFNFNRNNETNNAGKDSSTVPTKQPIVLQFNEDSITVSAADAEGKSIRDLFSEFGEDLGDVDRASRYVAAGRIVPGADLAVAGTVYRASVTSESKG